MTSKTDARRPKSRRPWGSLIGFSMGVAASVACAWAGPWWAVCLPSVPAGFLSLRARQALLLGAGCPATAWILVAFVADLKTGARLSERIGGVLQAPLPAAAAYLAVTAIAGVAGAFASWAGFELRESIWPSPAEGKAR